jgi:hypothetical protein
MKDADVREIAATQWTTGHRFQRLAAELIREGRVQFIHNRNDDHVYLVRMWLTTPRMIDLDGERQFDSSDSLLLHFFMHGDDDCALHDHPWDFETEIVHGGYEEHLPPHDWKPGSELGPQWDELITFRYCGERIRHRADSLHCVGRVVPGTMTMVRTGPKVRSWGFHPAEQCWVPWREFLNIRKPDLADA